MGSSPVEASEAYEKFTRIADCLLSDEIEDWKDGGGKVIGHFCSTVPEEIFTAAGMMPFRMRGTGSTSTEMADVCFQPINCTFPRHAFNQAMEGEYEFLDGLVVINSCDHIRRIYDNWLDQLDEPEFIHIMSLPRKTGDRQVEFYRDDIIRLRDALQEHFDVEITDDAIRDAIVLHNEVRALQRELYEMRKVDRPPITGAETLRVMVAGTALPKAVYKPMLAELVEELRGVEGPGEHRARVLITGSELDDPNFIEVVEGQGALVVTDATCFGTRLMWRRVDEDEPDPVRALARYYVHDRPSCPRMHGDQPRRLDFVRELCEEFKVDGVIGERINFCDIWQVEHLMTGGDLKEEGIPFTQIDREYVLASRGQLQTRVQAFVETLKGTD